MANNSNNVPLVPAAAVLNFDVESQLSYGLLALTHAPAVDAIYGIPTPEQVAAESYRISLIHKAQRLSGGVAALSPIQYAEAVIRHHTVVSAASGIGQQINMLNEQVNILKAQLNAGRARSYNSRFDFPMGWSAPYAAVVKYTPGHPWQHPPAVPDVNFEPEYLIDNPPPPNLVPVNNYELQRWNGCDDVAAIRQRLIGIYWFYNDQRLQLDDCADRATCQGVVRALDNFLKYP